MHNACTTHPSVKISHYIYTHRIRCPDCKQDSFYSIDLHWVCTQLLVCLIVHTCTECLFLFFCNLAGKRIGIIKFHYFFSGLYRKFIVRYFSQRQQRCKISCLILHFARICFPAAYHIDFLCIREKSLYQNSVFRDLRPH